MSQRQGINRIIVILKRLDSGEILNITKLSLEYEVSKRTVQRDFELLKELFGNFLKKENENYKAYEKIILKNILNSVELMTLANIINLFGISSLDTLATNEVNELIKSSMSVYSFRVRPFELIQDKETLKSIEHAIKFHKKIKLKYKSIDKVLMKIFSPYKILFINENFYIVGLNNSKSNFEFLRISSVFDCKLTNNVFQPNKKVKQFISQIQTPWSVFGKDEIIVRLRFYKKIHKYFLQKSYLPSQKIIQTYKNGDIEVEYKVTNLRELEDLIIKWLPFVEIISPQNLQKMIKKVLNNKLKALSTKPKN